MDNSILLSIIIPVFNVEKYVSQCLDSLLDQGLPFENYEIICVNDGSKDNSGLIINEYASKYSNIRIIDKENEGVSAARNRGIKEARGKYIWFIDADDWVAEDFLGNASVVKLLSGDPLCTPLVLLKCIDVYENDIDKFSGYRFPTKEAKFEEARPFMTTARGHFFCRELLMKCGILFDCNLSYGEDLMFMREMLDVIRFENEKGNNCCILQSVGEGIYLYRLHNESAMGQLGKRMEHVADSILYRARFALQRYKTDDRPKWYRENYQEYVNLFMQEYMLYYFPALRKPMWTHLKELKREGLYPSPPPKLGWVKPQNKAQRVRQFVFRHPNIYLLYYLIMRMKYKRAGTV